MYPFFSNGSDKQDIPASNVERRVMKESFNHSLA
jgi:hypothetical protein